MKRPKAPYTRRLDFIHNVVGEPAAANGDHQDLSLTCVLIYT